MGEGLDRRPAVRVTAEDRRGQREQLEASPVEVTTTVEPPRAEAGRLTRRTLHHGRRVEAAANHGMARSADESLKHAGRTRRV